MAGKDGYHRCRAYLPRIRHIRNIFNMANLPNHMDLDKNNIKAIAEEVEKHILKLGIETEFDWERHKDYIIDKVQERMHDGSS
jgi:hypothetical protein